METETKILFREYSDVLEEIVAETLWATVIDAERGYYKIENVPFYVKTAFENIIFAEFDTDENQLVYKSTVTSSGNSTIQVVILKKEIGIETVRKIIESKGCESEKLNDSFFVIDVPSDANYTSIQKKLDQLTQQGIIDYAELYLSENHR
ncbi:DUF4265 domain-containing protein [Flavobacterium caeni]|uniref:DUF4265 domain-containing protein n=1 Tax=Flavobacterium caeni TaxID=490189 RepID=UPI000B80579F|nr:DUF4265 domain-containing protein [Flavobacterium caeni]